MNLNHLHNIVWDFRDEMDGIWPLPDKYDSIRFALTEAAEAIDAELRDNPFYKRNREKHMTIDHELAQCFLMIMTALGDEMPDYVIDPVFVPLGCVDSVAVFCAEAMFLESTNRVVSCDHSLLIAAYQIYEIVDDIEGALLDVIDQLRTKFGAECDRHS